MALTSLGASEVGCPCCRGGCSWESEPFPISSLLAGDAEVRRSPADPDSQRSALLLAV